MAVVNMRIPNLSHDPCHFVKFPKQCDGGTPVSQASTQVTPQVSPKFTFGASPTYQRGRSWTSDSTPIDEESDEWEPLQDQSPWAQCEVALATDEGDWLTERLLEKHLNFDDLRLQAELALHGYGQVQPRPELYRGYAPPSRKQDRLLFGPNDTKAAAKLEKKVRCSKLYRTQRRAAEMQLGDDFDADAVLEKSLSLLASKEPTSARGRKLRSSVRYQEMLAVKADAREQEGWRRLRQLNRQKERDHKAAGEDAGSEDGLAASLTADGRVLPLDGGALRLPGAADTSFTKQSAILRRDNQRRHAAARREAMEEVSFGKIRVSMLAGMAAAPVKSDSKKKKLETIRNRVSYKLSSFVLRVDVNGIIHSKSKLNESKLELQTPARVPAHAPAPAPASTAASVEKTPGSQGKKNKKNCKH